MNSPLTTEAALMMCAGSSGAAEMGVARDHNTDSDERSSKPARNTARGEADRTLVV
jgi:hypothetical protein